MGGLPIFPDLAHGEREPKREVRPEYNLFQRAGLGLGKRFTKSPRRAF